MKKDKDKMTFILNRIKEYMNTYNCTIENAINWSLSDWNHNFRVKLVKMFTNRL